MRIVDEMWARTHQVVAFRMTTWGKSPAMTLESSAVIHGREGYLLVEDLPIGLGEALEAGESRQALVELMANKHDVEVDQVAGDLADLLDVLERSGIFGEGSTAD